MCERESPMHAKTSLPNRLKICVGALGVNTDVFFKWGLAACCPRPPKSAPKPPRATEDGPVSRFSKFLFEKVGTGMCYVHAKNIGHNLHPTAIHTETAPKPPRAAKHSPVGQFSKYFFFNGHRSPPAAKPRTFN